MTKPTEGPWESTGTVIWSPSAKAVIACVSNLRPASGMAEFERADVFDADLDEIMANRDLIAAAPTMFETLEEVSVGLQFYLESHGDLGALSELLGQVNDAIEKGRPR